MHEYRGLTSADICAFDIFLGQINNTVHGSNTWKFAKKHLLLNSPEVIIVGEFINGLLVSIILCYSVDSLWETGSKLLYYWVAGVYHSITNTLTPALLKQRSEAMMSIAVAHFETLGFNSFFVGRQVSSRLSYSNCESYLIKQNNAAMSIDRYDGHVEAIYDSSTDFDKLRVLHRVLSFSSCPPNKKIAIIKYSLKYNLRLVN